ncbi:MAG: PSD1 and planctomycete cytochrome C domain-containing protein [Planctomycetaceae bacterium]
MPNRHLRFGFSIIVLTIACWLSPRIGKVAEQQEGDDLTKGPADAEIVFSDDDLEFFEKKVRPILVDRCHACHNDKDHKGELRLTSRENLLKGGESGLAVIPGDIEQSELIRAIRYDADSFQMPPKGKLPAEEIVVLTEWVRRKVPWTPTSSTTTANDGKEDPKAIPFEKLATQWPYRTLHVVPPPTVKNTSWTRNLIDSHILSGLEQADLVPAPEADKRTWLRRVSFDLAGLPPTPDEIDDFLADDSPDAFDRVIDRLLGSVHYGERWARHWLDLVRYAETQGHEFDFDIPHAWRYRDYVIRALNAGVPYDQFVVEHLAGDLLQHPRCDPVTGENESIKGTAFYWLGQGKHSPVDIRAEECDTVDNQIDVFSKTFLGLTVACARCHDHKFDPISTADYYALAGYLQSSRQQWVDVSKMERDEANYVELGYFQAGVKQLIVNQWDEFARDDRIAQLLLDVRPLLKLKLLEPGTFSEPRIEGELLKIVETTVGNTRPQAMEGFGKGLWSGDKHLWWTDGKIGATLTLEIPHEQTGKYHVRVALTKARDYGIVQMSLDDETIGDPVDLYNPQVVPTGPISLGIHELKAGNHRLTFKITGKNDNAEPAYMVGIDYVALTPSTSDAEPNNDLLTTVDPHLLTLARAIQTRSSSDPTDLFYPWNALSMTKSADEFQQRKEQLRDEWIAIKSNTESQVEPQPQWTSFEVPDEQQSFDWRPSGIAFESNAAKPGELVYSSNDGKSFVNVVTRSSLHSGMGSRKLQGFIRSPTFPIERKFIDYRVRRIGGLPNPGRGNKNGNISLIVDGFQIIRNPLWGHLTFVVPNDGQWHWHRQDVSKHVGATAYIEVGDEDDGFIEVAEIRLTDNNLAPSIPNNLMIELLSDESIATPEQLAAGYDKLIRDSVAKMKSDSPTGLSLTSDEASFADLLAEITRALSTTDALKPSKELQDEQSKLLEAEQKIPPPVWTLGMTDGSAEDAYILIRGNHTKPGDIVERRFLTIFDYSAHDGPKSDMTRYGAWFPSTSGRLELALEMIDSARPLMARVIVNRIWQHHFGEGIVQTPDNFGKLGLPPSHPELLDALATELIAHDWSIKHIHRLIVSSATYRMSSQTTDTLAQERDPNNRLLHRMNVKRLEGEVLRDSLLALSGRFNPQMFGPSVPPHLTSFMEGRGRPGQSGPLDGDGRRSIYLGVRRNFLSPMFLAFDLPTPLSTMGKRSSSNVPAQALTLMNNPFVWEQAGLWSTRIGQSHSGSAEERIRRMYESALARQPEPDELEIAFAFLEVTTGKQPANTVQESNWNDLSHLLINLKEFVFIP